MVGVAVNVTEVPSQIADPGFAATLMDAAPPALTCIVITLDVAGEFVVQE